MVHFPSSLRLRKAEPACNTWASGLRECEPWPARGQSVARLLIFQGLWVCLLLGSTGCARHWLVPFVQLEPSSAVGEGSEELVLRGQSPDDQIDPAFGGGRPTTERVRDGSASMAFGGAPVDSAQAAPAKSEPQRAVPSWSEPLVPTQTPGETPRLSAEPARADEVLNPANRPKHKAAILGGSSETPYRPDPNEPLTDVRFEGNATIPVAAMSRYIKSRPGRAASVDQVRDDVRALYNTKWFFSIEPVYRHEDGNLVLIYKVTERPILQSVEYRGNKKIKDNVLAGITGLKPLHAYSVATNREAARRIKEHYIEKGHLFAEVELLEGNSPEERTVVFDINEGPKVHVSSVVFKGNSDVSSEVLKLRLSTKKRILWLFGGQYDPTNINEDVAAIKEYYHNIGYFDVLVDENVEFSEDRSKVTVTFEIAEGPRYRIRDIRLEGNQIFSREELTAKFSTKSGEFFSSRLLTKDVQSIQTKYGELGRLFAKVRASTVFAQDPGIVDLVLDIDEDRVYKIGMVNVHIRDPNSHTRETVALNQMLLAPGELADPEKIRRTKARFAGAGIWEAGGPMAPDISLRPVASPSYVSRQPKPADELIVRGSDGFFGGDKPLNPDTLDLPESLKQAIRQANGEPPGVRSEPQSSTTAPPQAGNSGKQNPLGLPTQNGTRQLPTSEKPRESRPVDTDAPTPPREEPLQSQLQPTENSHLKPGAGHTLALGTPAARSHSTTSSSALHVTSFQQAPPGKTVRPEPLQRLERTPHLQAEQTAQARLERSRLSPPEEVRPAVQTRRSEPDPYLQPASNQAAAEPGWIGQMESNRASDARTAATPDPLSAPPAGWGHSPRTLYEPIDLAVTPVFSEPDEALYLPAVVQPEDGMVIRGQSFDNYTPPPNLMYGQTPQGDLLGPQLPSPAIPPGYVDLDVYLSEARTGRFMVGAGVNSDAGVIGNIVLEEQNFDITRFPTSFRDVVDGYAFRGGGQQFRMEAMPGNEVSRYLVNWTDPFFLNTDYSLGLSGFYYQRFFRDWTENRAGGRINVGKLLTRELSVNAALRMEHVDIRRPRLPPGMAPSIDEMLGHSFLGTGRFTVGYDTRDSAFMATEGFNLNASVEQAFAEYDFTKLELLASQYYTVYQRPDGAGKHIFSMRGTLGWTTDNTPAFERFYAGGFQSFRGFEFRSVSPLEPGNIGNNGAAVGGMFQMLGTVEYMLPVMANEALRVVAFSDFGTVEEDVRLDNFRVSVGAGLRITIPQMGPVPIALDWAVPVIKQDTDIQQIFSFYIGLTR